MLLSCRLAQVRQLPPHEEGGHRDAEDGLRQEQHQVLLAAVAVLALHHLEGEEDCPQQQQLDHLHLPHHTAKITRLSHASQNLEFGNINHNLDIINRKKTKI